MGTTMNKETYQEMIREDIDEVKKHMPPSLERDHVICVLEQSIDLYYPERRLEAGQVETVVICYGCKVNSPWEHRCFGEGCGCDEPVCMERQGRITPEELMDTVNKHMESK